MKTRILSIIGILGLSLLITPASFGDNEFCNIDENLKIQEELIKDDDVLVEFLKIFPGAELTRANYVDFSNPEQTSMKWTAGAYSLDIHIWGFDQDNPSNCFFPGGYRMNAPHLPEMSGSDYHKDPKAVLGQIEKLEPKYVKGGPALMLEDEPENQEFGHMDFRDAQGEIMDVGCSSDLRASENYDFDGDVLQSLKCDPAITLTLVFMIIGIAVGIVLVVKRKRK